MDTKRTGRRPGHPDTRGEVLAAAQDAFIEFGYASATIRGIARAAGVDPALIHRWFGDKRGLFLATVRSEVDFVPVIERVVAAGAENLGVRIAHVALSAWESPMGRARIEAVRRTPALLSVIVGYLNDPLTDAGRRLLWVSEAEARLRVSVVESLMMGFVTSRFIAPVEPFASLPHDDAVRIMAPFLQHGITGALGVEPALRSIAP